MARGKLSEKEWDALDALRFSTSDAVMFRNATVVLMTDVGRSKHSIAQDLGCSPATVDNVRKRYREQGLAGLRPRKSPGRTSRDTGVSGSATGGCANAAAEFRIWIQRLVGCSAERTSEAENEDKLQ